MTSATGDSAPEDGAPAWFTAALATKPEIGTVDVAGATIAYRAWGDAGLPGLVLVHGGAAHARWWDHIGPMLAGAFRVVAMDLSGHGDSGRRPDYSLRLWAEEVLAVAGSARIAGHPIVVGHSMGGWVSVATAAHRPGDVAGIVIIDSPIIERTPEDDAARRRLAFGPLHTYASRDNALRRFRTVPPQDCLPYIRAHIAETSLRPADGGWVWKFDPAVFARGPMDPGLLRGVRCRVALLRPEHGLVTPDISDRMYELLGRVAPVVEIPLAGHHVMLDEPLSLITSIRTLLADWQHSTPATRL